MAGKQKGKGKDKKKGKKGKKDRSITSKTHNTPTNSVTGELQIEDDPEMSKCMQFWDKVVINKLRPYLCKCSVPEDAAAKSTTELQCKKKLKEDDLDLKFWIEAVKSIQKKHLDDVKLRVKSLCETCTQKEDEKQQEKEEVKNLNNWKSASGMESITAKLPKEMTLQEKQQQLSQVMVQRGLSSLKACSVTDRGLKSQDRILSKTKNLSQRQVGTSRQSRQQVGDNCELIKETSDECPCGCGIQYCICNDLKKSSQLKIDCKCSLSKIENAEDVCCKCGCNQLACICQQVDEDDDDDTIPCQCAFRDDSKTSIESNESNTVGVQCQLIKAEGCTNCID